MKWFLIVVLVVLCGYVGYGFGRYYVLRYLFFKDMGFFLEKLNLKINFSKDKILQILNDFTPSTNQLKVLIENYASCLEKGKLDEEHLFNKINILKQEEKTTIYSFLKSVGRFDTQLQTLQIEAYQKNFKKYESDCEQEKNKYAPLFYKFGIIIGVLIGLILI